MIKLEQQKNKNKNFILCIKRNQFSLYPKEKRRKGMILLAKHMKTFAKKLDFEQKRKTKLDI